MRVWVESHSGFNPSGCGGMKCTGISFQHSFFHCFWPFGFFISGFIRPDRHWKQAGFALLLSRQAIPSVRSTSPACLKPGKLRPITKPNAKEKLVIKALSITLDEVWTNIFLTSYHGFRRKKGVRTSFFTIAGWGKIDQLISADVVGCFDHLDHALLLKFVTNVIPDDRMGKLIMNFAKVDILDRDGKNYAGEHKGIPQGCSVSPVLMNIYLHPFYVNLSAFLSPYGNVHYLRYADDLLIGFREPDALFSDRIVNEMNVLMKDLKLEWKIKIHPLSSAFLFLGQIIKYIDGTLTLEAPWDRIRKKIREKQVTFMVAREEDLSVQDRIIQYYYGRLLSYYSFYARVSNYMELREMVRKELREKCWEQLSRVEHKSRNDIKKLYGRKLEKHRFDQSDRELNDTWNRLRAHYRAEEQKFFTPR